MPPLRIRNPEDISPLTEESKIADANRDAGRLFFPPDARNTTPRRGCGCAMGRVAGGWKMWEGKGSTPRVIV